MFSRAVARILEGGGGGGAQQTTHYCGVLVQSKSMSILHALNTTSKWEGLKPHKPPPRPLATALLSNRQQNLSEKFQKCDMTL